MPISCCNPITMNGAAIVLSFLLIALSSALDCTSNGDCSASVQITKRDVRERKQDPRCPKNAEYRECTNMCPDKHCGNILEKSSCFSLRCGAPGCMCVEGHVLKTQNIKDGCVRRETCLAEARKSKVQKRYNPFYDIPVPKCKPTESLRSCGSACEPSCAVPHYEYCTYQCAMNACQCKQGLLRHKNGECVRPEECH
uniref:TIL domain-containing protein n=1 Tax=Steinernema glaseri TaxID=37863 RepID=A0A1I7ZU28_9BILA